MQPHWLIPRTQQCVHLASDESAEATREKLRNKAKKKRTQYHIPLSTFDRSKVDPFMKIQPPQFKWEKKINILMPPSTSEYS